MSSDYYKYLKYKSKYIDLKNILYGGWLESNEKKLYEIISKKGKEFKNFNEMKNSSEKMGYLKNIIKGIKDIKKEYIYKYTETVSDYDYGGISEKKKYEDTVNFIDILTSLKEENAVNIIKLLLEPNEKGNSKIKLNEKFDYDNGKDKKNLLELSLYKKNYVLLKHLIENEYKYIDNDIFIEYIKNLYNHFNANEIDLIKNTTNLFIKHTKDLNKNDAILIVNNIITEKNTKLESDSKKENEIIREYSKKENEIIRDYSDIILSINSNYTLKQKDVDKKLEEASNNKNIKLEEAVNKKNTELSPIENNITKNTNIIKIFTEVKKILENHK